MRFRPATVLLALLPTAVSGCSRSSASHPTVLNIWSGPKGTEERAFNKLCRRFETEHPGVMVRNLGSLLEDKLIRAIVAGAPPDLAYLYGTSDLGPLAANGALTELDDYFAAAGLKEDMFLP